MFTKQLKMLAVLLEDLSLVPTPHKGGSELPVGPRNSIPSGLHSAYIDVADITHTY